MHFGLTEEQQKALVGKTKSVPHPTELGKWHDLQVAIGDAQLAFESGEIVIDDGTQGGVHHRGAGALVFADLGEVAI